MSNYDESFKVLLVDDNKSIIESLGSALSDFGYDVTTRSNGREALDFIEKERPEVVLSDVRMPYLGGFELLDSVKKSNLDETAVVLFTGYGEIEDAVNAMKLGAFDYLLKPLDVEEVCKAIDKAARFISIIKENKMLKECNQSNQEKLITLEEELRDFKKAYSQMDGNENFCFHSEVMRKLVEEAQKIHKNPDLPVLIEGETGVGKEMFARIIHNGAAINPRPFVAVNCPSINPNLFESEIFGYESGAFTGSSPGGNIGKIKLAEGGTLLFDEVTEMSLELQAKLLRVIQEREYYQVGGIQKLLLNTRLLFTTNRKIEESVKRGFFREDLYYRIKVASIKIPPLRERREDILPLVYFFMDKLSREKSKKFKYVSKDAAEFLYNNQWKGNVRQLKNLVESVILTFDDLSLKIEHIEHFFADTEGYKPPEVNSSAKIFEAFLKNSSTLNLEDIIKKSVIYGLQQTNGNKSKAAKFLNVSRTTLYTLIKKYSLEEYNQ